jgi:hypothetical protein
MHKKYLHHTYAFIAQLEFTYSLMFNEILLKFKTNIEILCL